MEETRNKQTTTQETNSYLLELIDVNQLIYFKSAAGEMSAYNGCLGFNMLGG